MWVIGIEILKVIIPLADCCLQYKQYKAGNEDVALHVNLDKTPSLRWETFAA